MLPRLSQTEVNREIAKLINYFRDHVNDRETYKGFQSFVYSIRTQINHTLDFSSDEFSMIRTLPQLYPQLMRASGFADSEIISTIPKIEE